MSPPGLSLWLSFRPQAWSSKNSVSDFGRHVDQADRALDDVGGVRHVLGVFHGEDAVERERAEPEDQFVLAVVAGRPTSNTARAISARFQ